MTAQTTDVLRSFETINKSIMFRGGQLLNSRSLGGNIIAEYQCEENFPKPYAVYDLGQFLKGLSLFDSPFLNFNDDNFVVIRNQKGGRSAKYFFSDPSIVESASPNRRLNFPEESVVIEFRITESDLQSLWRAAGVYELEDLLIESSDNTVVISLFDSENETNNTYSITLDAQVSCEHKCHMKVENLYTLMKGSYDVSITDGIVTRWKNTNLDLVYYISTEDDE